MLQWTWECICLFEAVFLCSPNQYSVEPLLGHVVVVFIFSGTSILFVTVAAPISIPTNSAQCLLVLTPPGVCLWDNCCSNSCDSRSWVCLMFPWRWLVMSNNFFCLLAPVCHLWKVSIHVFPPFFIQFFFCFDLYECCVYFDISLFSHIWFADIFFLLGQWPFKFLMVSFAVWKISVWCCSTCLFLLLLPLHLVSDLKTLCQNQCRET